MKPASMKPKVRQGQPARHKPRTTPSPRTRAPGPTRDGRVVILGDSHVSFLSGIPGLQPLWPRPAAGAIPGIRTIRLGQFLAHSVTRPAHPVRRALREALATISRDTPVVLCFGEIDCRNHVFTQARRTGRTIEQVASDLADRYAHNAAKLTRGRRAALLSVPPATDRSIVNPDYPAVGSFEERTRAVRAFNDALAATGRRLGLPVIDVFTPFAGRDGRPRREFLPDGVHLGVQAIPRVVRELTRAALLIESTTPRLTRQAVVRALVSAGSRAERAIEREKKRIVPPLPPQPLSVSLAKPVFAALIDRAARACRDAGARTIAIFGAGRHTRKIGLETFRRHGLRVAAILDDAPRHQTMMGVTICPPAHAGPEIEAIVISSDVHEATLAARAAQAFAHRPVPIVRIYTDQAA